MKNLKFRPYLGKAVGIVVIAVLIACEFFCYYNYDGKKRLELMIIFGVLLLALVIGVALDFFVFLEFTDDKIVWRDIAYWLKKKHKFFQKNGILISDIISIDVQGLFIYIGLIYDDEAIIDIRNYFNFDREEIIKRVYEIKKQIEEKSKQEEVELFDRNDLQQINKS